MKRKEELGVCCLFWCLMGFRLKIDMRLFKNFKILDNILKWDLINGLYMEYIGNKK